MGGGKEGEREGGKEGGKRSETLGATQSSLPAHQVWTGASSSRTRAHQQRESWYQ